MHDSGYWKWGCLCHWWEKLSKYVSTQTDIMQTSQKTGWVRFPFLIFSDKEFFFNWFNVSGRSFQSSQLALEVSHTGPCKSPCPGMESLGQFQAFSVRATNFGKIFPTPESFPVLLANEKIIHRVTLQSHSWIFFC